jgi:hypothetical protein
VREGECEGEERVCGWRGVREGECVRALSVEGRGECVRGVSVGRMEKVGRRWRDVGRAYSRLKCGWRAMWDLYEISTKTKEIGENMAYVSRDEEVVETEGESVCGTQKRSVFTGHVARFCCGCQHSGFLFCFSSISTASSSLLTYAVFSPYLLFSLIYG